MIPLIIFYFLPLISIILFSVALHEYAHGWTANRLGDPTPKISGRLTLNPFAHIDCFGMLILPFLCLLIFGFPFGYAKPIPINIYHFKNPKKDLLWVGLSGPLSNILIALSLSLILKIHFISLLSSAVMSGIYLNLMLAVFNLIPVPPLDGSRIITALLPYRLSYHYLRFERFGYLLIPLLIIFGSHTIVMPIVNFIGSLLGI